MAIGIRTLLTTVPTRRVVSFYLRGGAGLDRVVAMAGAGARRRSITVQELERQTLAGIDIITLQRAEVALDRIGGGTPVTRRLRQALAEAQPHLAYPVARHALDLLDTDRIKAMMSLLERTMESDDFSGVDLDAVLLGALLPVRRDFFVRVILWAKERPDLAGTIDPVRLAALVDGLTDEEREPSTVINDWVRDDADELLAMRTAVALHVQAVMADLVCRRGIDELRPRQVSRTAALLWRAGEVELAVQCSERLQENDGGLGRRARDMLGEYESFVMMDQAWTPPAAATGTPYEPRRRSIVHAIQNSLPHRVTGSANRTHGLLSGLVRHGYEINAVTAPGFPFNDVGARARADVEPRQSIDGVVYHHLLEGGEVMPVYPLTEYIDSFSGSIERVARKEEAALIHSASNAYNALSASVAARRLGLPHVYEVRGLNEEGRRSLIPEYELTPQYRFAKHIETLAASEADRVIAITQGLRDTLVDRGIDPVKIEVVPNGVDTQRFVPLERDVALEREYGLEGKVVIGYVGSLNWYEGLPLLFQAVARLRDAHPELRVLVVGGGSEGENLHSLRAELGLEDIVLMTGKVPFDQVEAHYSLIDVAPITRVSSPVTEIVSPLKPFEAMAMGKTLVSSDVAVMAEFVEDDVNGLLFRKDDVDSLESVLSRLLDDEALRRRLAGAGREWVVVERDWNVLASRVTALYEALGAS